MTDELRREAMNLPSWTLTLRQLCDFELLANGGFAPLTGFLRRADYDRVLADMRLADGTLWPIPVTLGVSKEVARQGTAAGRLALRDSDGTILGVLHVEDAWEPDIAAEAEAVFGTANREHAGVAALFDEPAERYVGGGVEALALPEHFDFRDYRHTPAELRAEFSRRGWTQVVAFQTRNPMHRAHYELTVRAASPLTPLLRGEGNAGLKLLIHPSVGATKAGDVDHYTRVRCYKALLPRYAEGSAMLSLLPLAMRMAGPREALWHAIIRKNYGCTHFIVGRDHAGPGPDSSGKPFYAPDTAARLAGAYQHELGVQIVASDALVYVPELDDYVPEGEVPAGKMSVTVSGTELRSRLASGGEIPEWFTFPEVASELRRAQAPPARPGVTIWLTGLPASGKSTIAGHLVARLLEGGDRPVRLLDGDMLRRTVSAGLGFSRADREEHVRRVAALAAEIVKEGGIAVCPVIAPYDSARREARALVERYGRFVLVYVATPLVVCEQRDPKGLYAKARAGTVKEFTGISDLYEAPTDAEVVVGASDLSPAQAAGRVLGHIMPVGE